MSILAPNRATDPGGLAGNAGLMAVWKLGPALAARRDRGAQPAEQTPLSALRLGELMLGAKESCWGREMSHNALDNYLEGKSVVTQLAERGDRAMAGAARHAARPAITNRKKAP